MNKSECKSACDSRLGDEESCDKRFDGHDGSDLDDVELRLICSFDKNDRNEEDGLTGDVPQHLKQRRGGAKWLADDAVAQTAGRQRCGTTPCSCSGEASVVDERSDFSSTT